MPMQSANSLPEPLFAADAVRQMDRYLIDTQGVDGFELMQSAARSAFRQLLKRWPNPRNLLVLCGAGNNGGDGYLIAANAHRHGIQASCLAVAPTGKLTGDAHRAFERTIAEGVSVHELAGMAESALAERLASAELVVDAMLGTGVTGAPREPFASVIRAVNGLPGTPVLAVDVPSGLNATTGHAEGEVIQADLTVTFIGAKAGLYTGTGAGVCGQVVLDTLVPAEQLAESQVAPLAGRQTGLNCRHWVPVRPRNAHKGRFGHVLIVAGERGFGGAGILAAEAASRSGAGLVSLATRPEHLAPALCRCPSVMVHGVIHGSELPPLLARADVVVCGPGLGKSAWGQQMLQQVLQSECPRVLDADALNLMAARAVQPSECHVLTPHPGEAARLLGCDVPTVEADRLAAARKLQKLWGGVVLLKGAGTVVAAPDTLPVIVDGGNPGMATGGMGDVLSGMLGALLAQLHEPAEATILAAAAHVQAADLASEQQGFMGLLPGDVIEALPRVYQSAEAPGNREEV
ncbi:MAG: NAD(P)H-hydrate dehydratase [Pseudomonadota bacterium]|nr:NAD(P)H-hydrate dehydratase [Pseudomonadota bacterium]